MLVQQTTPLLDPLVSLCGPIVVGAKPLVPGRFEGAVVAIEVAVMQLVEKVPHANLDMLAEQQVLIPGVRGDSGQGMKLQNENRVYRVRKYEQEYEHVGQPDRMFDRMHCRSRPGAGIGIFMMPAMRNFVEEGDMQ